MKLFSVAVRSRLKSLAEASQEDKPQADIWEVHVTERTDRTQEGHEIAEKVDTGFDN